MKKEIVILGCGLSGMLTALSFANMNITSTIIEYQAINDDTFCSDIRTTALTPTSSKFLHNINLWSEIEPVASKMLDVYIVNNKAPEMLHFSNITNDGLGYVVKNSQFKKILLSKVKDHPLITIIDQCDYKIINSELDHSTIQLSTNKLIICHLLIVCDGHNSKVRQRYFSNKIDKSYQQTALTFNIKHEKDHENCAVEHFMPSGPFAILPLKNQNSSSIIWTTQAQQAPLLLNLPIEEFEYLVQRNCGKALGKITLETTIVKSVEFGYEARGEKPRSTRRATSNNVPKFKSLNYISAFPLKARIANKYFHNKIVLVADSAHIIHPLAGQGLNQGIKDIEALVQLIINNDINQETLQQYQRLRQDDNLTMYMVTEGLNNIFSNYSKYLWYLSRIGLMAIDNLNPIKNLLIKYAMGHR